MNNYEEMAYISMMKIFYIIPCIGSNYYCKNFEGSREYYRTICAITFSI